MKIGLGFDAHRLVKNRRLVLGGVNIPHDKGLLGHSDADVLIHAVMDALLGAAAMGDIGVMFPDSDEKYRNADSLKLLAQVHAKIAETGLRLINLDAVIMAERPKLRPFIPLMIENMAECLGAAPRQLSIKATTTEKMGMVGREEGIAAQAVVLLGE